MIERNRPAAAAPAIHQYVPGLSPSTNAGNTPRARLQTTSAAIISQLQSSRTSNPRSLNNVMRLLNMTCQPVLTREAASLKWGEDLQWGTGSGGLTGSWS